MTRGIIVFIGRDGGFCVSTEFNGDMHSYSNGLEIIEKYKERKLITKSDYIKFVTAFDRKHYRYGDEEFEIIHYGGTADDTVNLPSLYPDYFYIINHSGKKISFTCRKNTFELEDQTMTVTYFDKVEQVVRMNPAPSCKLSKERFVEILDTLKAAKDFSDEHDKLLSSYRSRFDTDFMDGAGFAICHDNLVVELLQTILDDTGELIDYFVYEMEFGRRTDFTTITDNDREIRIASAEDLYDYLTSNA